MPVGSLAIVDSSKTQVSAGDVAAFVRNGQTVTHRIIRVTDDGYITKGDANENADTGVIQSQIFLALSFAVYHIWDTVSCGCRNTGFWFWDV